MVRKKNRSKKSGAVLGGSKSPVVSQPSETVEGSASKDALPETAKEGPYQKAEEELTDYLCQFESKAVGVLKQQAEPRVVEKIVEKIIEKPVEDPVLKQKLSELEAENKSLIDEVSRLKDDLSSEKKSRSTESSKIASLEEENRGLTDKLLNYQTVLNDTENLLKSLQASVENEEKLWQGRLSEKDQLVQQITADRDDYKAQLEQNLASRCKNEEAVKSMQEELRTSQMEKDSLVQEIVLLKHKLSECPNKDALEDMQIQLRSLQDEVSIAQHKSQDSNEGLVKVLEEQLRTLTEEKEALRQELSLVQRKLTDSPSHNVKEHEEQLQAAEPRMEHSSQLPDTQQKLSESEHSPSTNGPATLEQCSEGGGNRQ